LIHLKTDNKELYNFTFDVLKKNDLKIIFSTRDVHSEKTDNILSIRTHYEKIFMDAGQKINYISFRLNKDRNIDNGQAKIKRE
jgi:tRNA (guanine-N7-)-methyltransferase